MKRWFFQHSQRAARRVAITIAGVVVILAGIAMLVLPGPGLLTIVFGLMVLGLEFAFARRWVEKIKQRTHQGVDLARARLSRRDPPTGSSDPS
ncbi:MAG TPA: PGPGW domain-containing protein [Candidatus Krumholzibacteria bacterium]|nr:PGPGW domain-containing protein [Candidatus Krumholzibacteria bacterium]